MKLSVSRDAFLARLGVAARGVSTRSSIQTLSGVLIREEGSAVELQATDMEIGIRVKVDAEVESGTQPVVLPGRLLLDVVRSLPNSDLSLEYRSQTQDVEII
jgi:DNA polymerase III subunit beta